jgi:hypothetical protein
VRNRQDSGGGTRRAKRESPLSPNGTFRTKVTLEKINGRWYETMSKEDADSVHLAYTLLSDYLPAVNKGIQQCADAKALAKFLTDANAKFDRTMSPPKAESTK